MKNKVDVWGLYTVVCIDGRKVGKHVRETAVSKTYAAASLPQIKSRSERREATRAHAGLCGVHNSGSIAGVQLEEVLARGGGPTGTKQVSESGEVASLGLWSNCLPS